MTEITNSEVIYLNLVLQEGCLLQHIIEPQLDTALAQEIRNDRDVHVPSFIVIAARKA